MLWNAFFFLFFNRVEKTFLKMKWNPIDNFECIKIKMLLHGKMHHIHLFQDITQMLFHWCLWSSCLNYNMCTTPPALCIVDLLSLISLLICCMFTKLSGLLIFYFLNFIIIFFLVVCIYILFYSLTLQYCIVLPYINMNPPQVYTCSPSWTLLPPAGALRRPRGMAYWFSNTLRPNLYGKEILITKEIFSIEKVSHLSIYLVYLSLLHPLST